MAIEQRSAAWRYLNSWYLLLTLPLGVTSGLAFAYIGIRGRRMKWIWSALFYGCGTLFLLLYGPRHLDAGGREVHDSWVIVVLLIVWVASMVEAFRSRDEFLGILDVRQGGTPAAPPAARPAEPAPQPAATAEPVLARPAAPVAAAPAFASAPPPPPPPPAPPGQADEGTQPPRGSRVVDF